MEKIIIIGAGGFGREVLWTINDCNKIEEKYSVIGFIDNDKSLHGQIIDGSPVLGGLDWLYDNYEKSMYCIIAIATPLQKKKIEKQIAKINPSYTKIIHPSVICSQSVTIGDGTIIQPGVILTVNIKIGKHVHLNVDSTVGHDSIIGDHVTINPGVHINGNTTIGNLTYVGSGVVMKHAIKIGSESVIGAGAVLLDNVPNKSLFAGVPAKLKKEIG